MPLGNSRSVCTEIPIIDPQRYTRERNLIVFFRGTTPRIAAIGRIRAEKFHYFFSLTLLMF